MQFQVLVAIGMLHLQGWQMNHVHRAEGWQHREVQRITCITQLLQRGDTQSIIVLAQILAFVGMHYQCGIWSGYGHFSIPCREVSRRQEHCSHEKPLYFLHNINLFLNPFLTINDIQPLDRCLDALTV